MSEKSLDTMPARSCPTSLWNPKMKILNNMKAFYMSLFQRYMYVFISFAFLMLLFNVPSIEENTYSRDILEKRFFRNLYEDELIRKDSSKVNTREHGGESQVLHLSDVISQVLKDSGMSKSNIRSTNKVDVIFDKKGVKPNIYENKKVQKDPNEKVIYSVEVYNKEVSDSNSADSKMKYGEQLNNHFIGKKNEKKDITGKLGVKRKLKIYDREKEIEKLKNEAKFLKKLKYENFEEYAKYKPKRKPSEINSDISERKDEREADNAKLSIFGKEKLDIEETKKDEKVALKKITDNISNIKSEVVGIKEIDEEGMESISKTIDNNKKSEVVGEKKVKTEEINKKEMDYEELTEKETEDVDSLNECLLFYPNNGDSMNLENVLKHIMEYDNSENTIDDLSEEENYNQLYNLLYRTFQKNFYNIYKLHEMLYRDLTSVSIWDEYELDLYNVNENGLYTDDKDLELNENILSLNSKKNEVSTLRDMWNKINRNEEKKISLTICRLNSLYMKLKNKYGVPVFHSTNELNNAYGKFLVHMNYMKSYFNGIFNEWIKTSEGNIKEYRILIIACRLIWRKLKKNTLESLEHIINKTFEKKIKERELHNKKLVRLYKAKYQEEKHNYFWIKFLDEYKGDGSNSYKNSITEAPYIG
ncbi:exported protein (PHISTb) [Plasmodium reichenowi]|uniref:Exported protein (PHISTb) n=1 Tax=Plasmodium reichenowi TaxID=5854 RepID=A0A151LBP3_PLARE|nr:exported protein (PHISTb) [Plasmodium reichenowi]KYN96361.1 exported protein (PHISTb) [Plasmodium reichenowi]